MHDTCNEVSGCGKLNDNIDIFLYLKSIEHILSAILEEESLLIIEISLYSWYNVTVQQCMEVFS